MERDGLVRKPAPDVYTGFDLSQSVALPKSAGLFRGTPTFVHLHI